MKTRFVGSVLGMAGMAAVPLAMLALSAPASAQGTGQRALFEWRGKVDQEVRVQMQGGRTAVIAMGPRELTRFSNTRATSAVPAVDGYVSVQMREGRGKADVVQQPNSRNGYATVIRIRDTKSGEAPYDVIALWQPTGNYGYSGTGVYNNYGYDRYDNYGNYGRYPYNYNGYDDRYGYYGRYGTYPPPVVVVHRPPSIHTRPIKPGKMPVPPRGHTDPRHAHPRYPIGSVPNGKALPAPKAVPRPAIKPAPRPVMKPAPRPAIRPAPPARTPPGHVSHPTPPDRHSGTAHQRGH